MFQPHNANPRCCLSDRQMTVFFDLINLIN
jgi:hypothetical protein